MSHFHMGLPHDHANNAAHEGRKDTRYPTKRSVTPEATEGQLSIDTTLGLV